MKLRPLSLVTRLTVLAGLILTGTVLIFGIRSYQAGRQQAVAQWEERLSHEAGMSALKVQGFIADLARDARYLARIPSVAQYAREAPGSAPARQRVEEDFRALLLGKPIYFQLRLIGEADAAREKVRLDQLEGRISVTPGANLQQKGDREYITESRNLGPDGIYLSDFNLNQDFGHITQPFTPTLRAVTPVMQENGQRFGWIVINADLRPLLESLTAQTLRGVQLILANDEGSYLIHPAPAFLFGKDLGNSYNILRPAAEETGSVILPWLDFGKAYEFLPGLPRRFHVRTLTDGADAFAGLAVVRNQALTASALTALAGLLLLVALARPVTRRLRHVAGALTQFQTGHPASPLPEQPADEIGQLATAFNRMSGKIAEQVQTLTEARQLADEASRAKDDFLAVMSHEIRTPLNAVTGMLHVLDRNRPAPHQEPILRSLNAAASQLTSLLNEALDWSKIKAGGLVCEALPFELRPLLSDLELTHRPLAAQKGLRWSTTLHHGLPETLSGDRLRLSQVLHNLLSNAVKFTSHGFIRLEVSWQDNWLTCRVQDSGIGILETDIGRIFSPFDQAHGEIGRRFGGTGLGLSISRSLAGLMGGHLTVESQPEAGSTFQLAIPALSVQPLPPTPVPVPGALAGQHLLCVEDSALNREVLAAFLLEAQLTWDMAEDGAAALTALQNGPVYHAALLDLQLPDTNGIELAARLHALRPELPLIAVTAQADAATRRACLAAGMVAVVTKPIHPALLREAIVNALQPPAGSPAAEAGLPDPAPAPVPETPLLTELFASEPERLQRVLGALAGEFQHAAMELGAAAAARDLVRLKRLRHKLHSAIAGLHLSALDQAFAQLLAGDWTGTATTLTLLQEASHHCTGQADGIAGRSSPP